MAVSVLADPSPTFEALVTNVRSLELTDSLDALRTWKAAHPGAKAVGTFPVYVPTELIQAAGALPVPLFGAGGAVDIAHADARMQSFVCSISRSTLELAMRGMLEELDGMIFPSICDVARNLSGVWERNFPKEFTEFLHLPQNRDSPHAIPYAVAEYRRCLDGLAKLTGREVTDDDVRAAIRDHNEHRAAVGALLDRRRKEPWRIAAWECQTLLRAATGMEVPEHTRLIRQALDATSDRKSMDRVRVVVIGAFCEQPPVELLRSIEEAGCYVLEDDVLQGLHWFDHAVPTDGDPVKALAEEYVVRSPQSSVSHYRGTPKQDELPAHIRELDAAGVVFCTAKFCEPALYDQVLYKEILDKEDIPYVHLEFEEKMSAFDNVRTQVETFVESILFR